MADNLEEPERRSCAVCARVLHSVQTSEGEVHWVHADAQEADHVAVPVGQEEVRTEYRCDFCFADKPTWVLPTRAFETGSFEVGSSILDTASGENFSACEACARLIDKNQWSSLIMRVTKSWEDRHGQEMSQVAQTGLARFYRLLRKNITGALRYSETPWEGK